MGRDNGQGQQGTVFVSGAFAGIVSRTATAPLDRLKVIQQVHGSTSAAGVRCLYNNGGIAALFKGNSANVIKAVPETGIKFMAFEATSAWQRRGSSRASPTLFTERLVSGAMAGAASCVSIYPLEVIKTRMALAHHHSSVGECARSIVRREGAIALWQGLGASLLGIVPFCALDLALYASLKERVAKATGREPGSLLTLLCGASSSAVSQLATYPLALIRTNLQAAGMPGVARFDGIWDCALTTMRRGGGVRALYRGLMPNMLKGVPSLSIT